MMRLRRSDLLFLTLLMIVLPFSWSASKASFSADDVKYQWIDDTGKHTLEASFIKVENQSVYLRKTDGTEVIVPLSRLSARSKQLALSLAESGNSSISTVQTKKNLSKTNSEIEFRVLLIIKRQSDTYSPLFLPIRASMTDGEILRARRCFEVETPAMVDEITKGKVKFVPTVYISKEPLRIWDPQRNDSAEFYVPELVSELSTIAKPGDFDSVGYYFLHYDTMSGYSIPRAGYGVGFYSAEHALGLFAINCTPAIDPRDEIFLHEWMHGLDGFYGNKENVKLPQGMLHGGEALGYKERPWRAKDTFRGYMHWYQDYLNASIKENGLMVGLGSAAWNHQPIRQQADQSRIQYKQTVFPAKTYPDWVYQLMKGDLTNAELGVPLLPETVDAGDLGDAGWNLEMWNTNAGTLARVDAEDGGVLTIESPTPNDAGLVRKVRLKPFTNYLFTADVMTDNVRIAEKGGRYAVNLYAESSVSTKNLAGSKSWETVSLPFTTGANADTCRLKLALGGFSSVARGRARFRNVQLREIGYPLKP
jgi:hypothetical protein